MCGIAGQFCFGDTRSPAGLMKNLLLCQQIRGRDAAGIAYESKDKILFIKSKGSPDDFIKYVVPGKLWNTIASSPLVMMHARAKTQGSVDNNANNHPVIAANWVVTHNGMIRNDDDLVEYYDMQKERPAEVDTVAINLALGQGETIEESLAHLSTVVGSATFAAVTPHRPHELVLARINNGQPLYLNRTKDILYWSSDPDGIRYTGQPDMAGLSFVNMAVLPDNHALVITPDKIDRYQITPAPFWMPVKPRPVSEVKNNVVPFVPRPASDLTITTGFETDSIRAMTEHWYMRRIGENYDVALMTKVAGVTAGENYVALAKVAPQFESNMAALVADQPKQGKIITPYGRWFLGEKDGATFRGARRVRRYWETKVQPAISLDVDLPANIELQAALANVHTLERLTIEDEHGVKWRLLMCPWCGIITKATLWAEWNMTCNWCDVQSRAPEKEDPRVGYTA